MAPERRSDALTLLPLRRKSRARQRVTRSGVARQSLTAGHSTPVPNSRDRHAIWRLHLIEQKSDGNIRCQGARCRPPPTAKHAHQRRRVAAPTRIDTRSCVATGKRRRTERDHDARKSTSHHSMLKSPKSAHGTSQKGTSNGRVTVSLVAFFSTPSCCPALCFSLSAHCG